MYRSSDLLKTHLWCLLLGIRLDSPSWRHVFLEQLPPGICLSVSRTDGIRALVKICWTGQVLLSALCSRSRFLQEVLLESLLTRYCLHCSASSKSLLSWNGPVVGVLPPARLQRMNLRLTTSATKLMRNTVALLVTSRQNKSSMVSHDSRELIKSRLPPLREGKQTLLVSIAAFDVCRDQKGRSSRTSYLEALHVFNPYRLHISTWFEKASVENHWADIDLGSFHLCPCHVLSEFIEMVIAVALSVEQQMGLSAGAFLSLTCWQHLSAWRYGALQTASYPETAAFKNNRVGFPG